MQTDIPVRKIIHVDMDAFYASVEQLDNPELRGKPIAVGGSSQRGVVAAASYEARKFGVRSAMSSILAKRNCPDLIFVKARFDRYKEISKQIRAIFHEYTDLVEPLSLDEAYLDVTKNKKGNPSATLIAKQIRQRILEETGLNASAGISINKFIAKVASDINKPNGQKTVNPEEVIEFLENLEIRKFYGVGKVTAEKMYKLG
ncbi:MAG: DNA polymerase IV, partial [Pricia sp.]